MTMLLLMLIRMMITTMMMKITIVKWGLFSQLQQWPAEALNAENVTLGGNHLFRTCDFFLFKCSQIFFLWSTTETMPYLFLFLYFHVHLYFSLYLHLRLYLCLSSFFLTGGCWSNGAIERMVELRWCSNKQTTSIPPSNNFSGNSALVGISLKTKKQIQKGSLSMH